MFLVLDSISTHPETGRRSPLQTKFLGGMREDGESLIAAVKREAWNEGEALIHVQQKIYRERDRRDRDHVQHAFLARADRRRKLRIKPIPDGNSWLSAPYWATAKVLKDKLIRSHQPILTAALLVLDR